MMENDLEMYGETVETMREHVQLANDLGDYGSEEVFRQTLAIIEDDAHHVDHFLEDDTLVTEEAVQK
jgi:DNA-binding ferritin-like protein